ncbi:MAG: NfeD family protein [Zoogloea sp.]|nr:NfeD family protein [Zoogloea sp.]
MIPVFEWWHWAVLGLVLILAELAIPAFFVIWFGLGGLLVALAVLLVPSLSQTAQITLWTLASIAMVFAWFRVFRPESRKTRIGQADGEVIGEIGLMVAAVAPFERGRVRFQKPVLGSDEWVCISDEPIAAGARVRVVTVEGSFVKVVKA